MPVNGPMNAHVMVVYKWPLLTLKWEEHVHTGGHGHNRNILKGHFTITPYPNYRFNALKPDIYMYIYSS